jgi:hypothetical protein
LSEVEKEKKRFLEAFLKKEDPFEVLMKSEEPVNVDNPEQKPKPKPP